MPGGCPNSTLRQQTGAAYLPDCRGYELASAARAGGAALFPEGPTSPYASNPGRLAYAALLNSIPGAGEPLNSSLFGGDLYVASRTDTGWVTKYVGIPGSQSVAESSAPGGEYGEVPNGGPIDKGMNHFLVWDRKQHTLLAGGPLEGTSAPYIYDNEGKLVGRLPTNVDEIPGSETDMSEGGFKGSSRINPPMTHYAFSSIKLAFAPGGLVESPGSAYDNDIAAKTVTLISKTEAGGDIPLDPTAGVAEEFIRIPAISEDGSHILMSTAAPGGNVHLYMAIDDTEHFDISVDKASKNVGVEFQYMSADGSRVYFTTNRQMTPDDTDTSVDLYMWSDKTHSLTRVSDSGNLPGNTDACSGRLDLATATWKWCRSKTSPNATTRRWRMNPAKSTSTRRSSSTAPGASRTNATSTSIAEAADQYVATLEPSSPVERINISPDGAHMAFITKTKLTAYDNTGHAEMYLYDPAAADDQVRLLRAERRAADGQRRRQPGRPLHDLRRPHLLGHQGLPRSAGRQRDHRRLRVRRRPAAADIDRHRRQRRATNSSPPAWSASAATESTPSSAPTRRWFRRTKTANSSSSTTPARTAASRSTRPPPPCEAADECHGADSSAAPPPEIGTGARLGSGRQLPPGQEEEESTAGRAGTAKRCHAQGGAQEMTMSSRKPTHRAGRRARRRGSSP